MAKTLEQVLKDQLGNLLFEVAILTSTNSAQADEIEKLKKESVREPDNKTKEVK